MNRLKAFDELQKISDPLQRTREGLKLFGKRYVTLARDDDARFRLAMDDLHEALAGIATIPLI